VLQYEIRGPDGELVARVDGAWPDRLVALEYEGVRHHAARDAGRDEIRYARIEALGFTVVPADKRDLVAGSRRLPALLGRLLEGRPAA
jgi:hypothetical protein